MAILSPFVKLFITSAAYLAIVQGITWIILSFMVILLYSGAWKAENYSATYAQFLNRAFISLYVDDSGIPFSLFITPVALFVWAIIYLLASLVWVGISIHLLVVLKNERREAIRQRCKEWCYWTGLTCAIDLVLASLLATDYNYLVGQLNLEPISLIIGPFTFLPLAVGVAMTLAARGFVLWFLNLMFCVIIRNLPIRIFQQSSAQVNA